MCDEAKLKHIHYDIASVVVMCNIKEISVSFAKHNILANYAYDICQNLHVKYIFKSSVVHVQSDSRCN